MAWGSPPGSDPKSTWISRCWHKKWETVNFMNKPELITRDGTVSYRANNAVTEIRKELKRHKPSSWLINYLLNGTKYKEPMY